MQYPFRSSYSTKYFVLPCCPYDFEGKVWTLSVSLLASISLLLGPVLSADDPPKSVSQLPRLCAAYRGDGGVRGAGGHDENTLKQTSEFSRGED